MQPRFSVKLVQCRQEIDRFLRRKDRIDYLQSQGIQMIGFRQDRAKLPQICGQVSPIQCSRGEQYPYARPAHANLSHQVESVPLTGQIDICEEQVDLAVQLVKNSQSLLGIRRSEDGKFLIDQELASVHPEQSLILDYENDDGPWKARLAGQSCHCEPDMRFHAVLRGSGHALVAANAWPRAEEGWQVRLTIK